ncbi:MAG: Sec-independent protein translocase subunit TatA/TatB [Acidimicrobiales bacterium]
MFEGLLGPWHLLILAAVILVVVGPRKMVARWRGTADTIQRWVDPDEQAADASPADAKVARRSLARRLGRWFRRR